MNDRPKILTTHPFVERTLESHWFDSYRLYHELERFGAVRTRFGRFPNSRIHESAALPWAMPDTVLKVADGELHAEIVAGDGSVRFLFDGNGARFRVAGDGGTIIHRVDAPSKRLHQLSQARNPSGDPALMLVQRMSEDAPVELEAALAQNWIMRPAIRRISAPSAQLAFDPRARHRGRLWIVVAGEDLMDGTEKSIPGRIRFHQATGTWWIGVDAMTAAESHALHRILPSFDLGHGLGRVLHFRPIDPSDNVTTIPEQRASTGVYVPPRHQGVVMADCTA